MSPAAALLAARSRSEVSFHINRLALQVSFHITRSLLASAPRGIVPMSPAAALLAVRSRSEVSFHINRSVLQVSFHITRSLLASVPCCLPHVANLGYGVALVSRMDKLQVSFAKETYKRDAILQKRPIILSILLTVATKGCRYGCVNRNLAHEKRPTVCDKRPAYKKRDLLHMKRDLPYMNRELLYMRRDLCMWKETCENEVAMDMSKDTRRTKRCQL